jgi:tripartite ATP-independent transporter DctP family solute receptor
MAVMKQIARRTMLGALVMAIPLAGGAGLASAQEIVLRYATQMPARHHLTQADMRFAKTVNERTGGRVKIEIYPAGQLYKGTALVGAVRSGALDMGIIYGGAMAGMVPLIDIFDIPFVFSDYRSIQGYWNGKVGKTIRKQALDKGIRILSFGAYGDSFAVLNSKRPLRLPADFAGLKIRGNTPMSIEALKALGAAPLRMSSSEVYAALQRGTIDGASTGLGSIVSRKWFEVSKFVSITSASYSVWPVMIGERKWATLPADVRAVIQAAASESENYIIGLVEKKDRGYTAAIESKMATNVLSPAESKAWRAALAPVEKAYVERTGKEGANILKLVRSGAGGG